MMNYSKNMHTFKYEATTLELYSPCYTVYDKLKI